MPPSRGRVGERFSLIPTIDPRVDYWHRLVNRCIHRRNIRVGERLGLMPTIDPRVDYWNRTVGRRTHRPSLPQYSSRRALGPRRRQRGAGSRKRSWFSKLNWPETEPRADQQHSCSRSTRDRPPFPPARSQCRASSTPLEQSRTGGNWSPGGM